MFHAVIQKITLAQFLRHGVVFYDLFHLVACSVECNPPVSRSYWRFHRNRRKQSTDSVSS